MKVRNGFVSNSSSSSFILRGIKVKTEDLIKNFDIDTENNEINDYDNIDGYIGDHLWSILDNLEKKDIKLRVETTRDYFDGEYTGEFIIGDNYDSLSDGCVSEYKDYDKNDELAEYLSELGFGTIEEIKSQLKTYLQFIGNDNY